MLFYAEDLDTLLAYFNCALEVLLHHQVSIKLKKCKFLHPILEFVGVDIKPNGNFPGLIQVPCI